MRFVVVDEEEETEASYDGDILKGRFVIFFILDSFKGLDYYIALGFTMASNSKMGDDELRFQQRWEFRGGDNDNDSSTDGSKSCSTGEQILRKHQLASGLVSLDNEETSCDTSKIQQNQNITIPAPEGQVEREKAKEKSEKAKEKGEKAKEKGKKAKENKPKQSKRKEVDDSEAKRDSNEEVKRKKNTTRKNAYDPTAFGTFADSLINDLKATRESLLTWMREETEKLMGNDSGPKRKKKATSRGKKKQGKQEKSSENNKSEVEAKQNNSEKDSHFWQQNKNVQVQHLNNNVGIGIAINDRVGNRQETGKKNIRSNNNLGSSNQNAQKENPTSVVLAITAQSGKAGTSEKSAKGKKRVDPKKAPEDGICYSQGIGLSIVPASTDKVARLRSPIEQRFSPNSSGQLLSTMYLPVPTVLSRPPESTNNSLDSLLGNITQSRIARTKRNLNWERASQMFDPSFYNSGYLPSIQSNLDGSSSATGYPVPIHRALDGVFGIPNQFSLENLPRGENINPLSLGKNGGSLTCPGGTFALREHFLANNLQSLSGYRADGRILPYQIQNFKDGHLFPK